jgi:diguanylate cyclase (GGDEF)-like protein/PAS domain S-box-containing protein
LPWAQKRGYGGSALRILIVASVVLSAFLLRQGLEFQYHVALPPFLTFYPAVMLVALFLGLRQGLLATATATILTSYFILPPAHSFKIANRSDAVALGIFVAICATISVIADRARRYQQKVLALEKEKAQRENEELLHLFVRHALTPMAMCDNEMRYLAVSQRWTDEYHLKAEEIMGRSHYEIFPEIPERWREIHRRGLAGETIQCDEDRFERQDGSVQWLLWKVQPWQMRDGQIGGILIFYEDITDKKQAADALRASESCYRTAFQTSVDAIILTRLHDGLYLDVSHTFSSILGYEPEEVIGRTSLDLHIWADASDRDKMVDLLRRDGVCRNLEVRLRRTDGTIFWAIVSISTIEVNGEACMLSVLRDNTDAKRAETALRASENRYRIAFQTSQDAIVITRLRDGMYIDVNHEFENVVGYERDEVIGRTTRELKCWPNWSDREKVIDTLRRTGVCRNVQVQYRRKNGEIFWAKLSSSAIQLDGELCGLTVLRDISAARLAAKEIHTLAFFDPLTGLPNRRLLLERMGKSLTTLQGNHRHSALLFVDLDRFKDLNDTLGHAIGDLMLKEVARRLQSCVREADTICRSGGDEFAVWLEDLSPVQETSAKQAREVAEKILNQVNQSYELDGHSCRGACSIGTTIVAEGHLSANEILQQADIALYHAKGAGRNTVRFFAPALQVAVNTRAAMEEDLRQAIKYNQFLLYYQPQIEAGCVVGAEALLRWKHPRLGIIGPSEFILLAEETHLILPIGEWVLDAACKQAAQWAARAETAEIEIAVNISALQFREDDFVGTVLSALERNGAHPDRIKLELTETMLVENMDDLIGKMTELKGHGLRFSVDDFGTGYSSLTYLKRLPLDQLKIDRSFVRDILVDAGSGAIAKTIISLGKAMSLSVIAEGVETEEQRDFLASLGCHAYQGYLYSRPVPVAEFEGMIERFSNSVPVSGD